jgi:hypothetical protein
LGKALAIHGCRAYGRAISMASAGDWWRTVRAPLIAVAITTVVLTTPWAVIGQRRSLLLWLVPQALAISLPIGLAVGGLVNANTFRRRSAARFSMLVLVASLASFANLAWGFPAANQAFRVSTSGNPRLVRGVNELTLGELGALLKAGAHEPMAVAQPANRATIAIAYHSRWALWWATFLLVLFAFIVRTRTTSRIAIVAAAGAVSIGYNVLVGVGFTLAWNGSVSPAVGAWFANVIFVALTSVLIAGGTDSSREALVGSR